MINNKEVTKIVAASLLGDACINAENKNSVRFSLSQLPSHKDHLDFVAEYLETITPVTWYFVPPKKDIIICGRKTVSNGVARITTRRHPFYHKFYIRMYGTGIKTVDVHYLKLMDWQFLATWYMQDGARGSKRCTGIYKPVICTDCFSYGDQLLLRHCMIERLGITWNINKFTNADKPNQYRLYLAAKDINKFIDGIAPHMQKSFEYKLDVFPKPV